MKYKTKISDKFNESLGVSDERNDELAHQITKIISRTVKSGNKADFIVEVLNTVKFKNELEKAFAFFMAGSVIMKAESDLQMAHLLGHLEKSGIMPELHSKVSQAIN